MSDVAQPTVEDLAAIQARNVELRAQLIQQNAELEAALAASRSNLLSAAGFTDDDVRRLEHPEEFAHEKLAADLKAIGASSGGPAVAAIAPAAPAAPVAAVDADARAADLSALQQAEAAAKSLRDKLFG